MIIYCATSPSNKKYIGMTTGTLDKRIAGHKRHFNRSATKFYKAIRKYGWNSIVWETIETAGSLEELLFLEKYYIKSFDTFVNGYNGTLGGDGVFGYTPTDETKEFLRNKAKEQWAGTSEEDKKKLLQHFEPYRGLNKLEVVDTLGNVFKSLTAAAQHHEMSIGAVSLAIKEKRPTKKQICFKFRENQDSLCPSYMPKIVNRSHKKTEKQLENMRLNSVLSTKIKDSLGNTYVSISEASRVLKINRCTVQRSLKLGCPVTPNKVVFTYG